MLLVIEAKAQLFTLLLIEISAAKVYEISSNIVSVAVINSSNIVNVAVISSDIVESCLLLQCGKKVPKYRPP